MLTQADIDLLNFEDTHPRHTGLKTDAIRVQFNMPASRYYQRLHVLVRRQEVLERWPQMAYRVQRRVQRRLEQRERLMEWVS